MKRLAQPNNNTIQPCFQLETGYKLGGGGEVTGSKARYFLQLNNLLRTARRQNNRRVIFALSSLITRRGGVI